MSIRQGNARNSPVLEEPARLAPGGQVHWITGSYGHRRTICGIQVGALWIAPFYQESDVCKNCAGVKRRRKISEEEEEKIRKKLLDGANQKAKRRSERERRYRQRKSVAFTRVILGGRVRLIPTKETVQNQNARACAVLDPADYYRCPHKDQIRDPISQSSNDISIESRSLLSEVGISVQSEDEILGPVLD